MLITNFVMDWRRARVLIGLVLIMTFPEMVTWLVNR